MARWRWNPLAGLVLLVLLGTSCVGAQSPRATVGDAAPSQPTGPKRVTAAIMSEPQLLSWKLSAGDNLRAGLDTVEPLIIVGLTANDNVGQLRPILAEDVPTIENGRWRLFPDGRMETTWRIRNGAVWHDGTPVTAEDFAFTATVVQDASLAALRDARYRFIESVETPDPRTVTVRWRQPFVEADAMFGGDLALPLPSHLLAASYAENKATFLDLPYWSDEFVGTGPFKVKSFVRGTHVVLEANDQYVLGRPKIDTIEVRLILDSNALVANVLAGVVELTLGRSISVEQGLDIQNRWREGKIEVAPVNFLRLFPQFIDPVPPIQANLQFRRALLHGIDRQEMVDTLMYGVSPIAHSFMDPGQPAYKDIEDRYVVRYDYDLRRAAQMIEGLGYTKDASGMYQAPASEGGGPLTIETLVSASQEINVKSMFAVADYWQRLGVNVKREIEPTQLSGTERRVSMATRPGFFLTRQGGDVANFPRLFSSEVPLPENNHVGNNASRYMNRDLDGLLERYYVTIPIPERRELIGQIIHHISDQLVMLPLFYGAEPIVVGNRLANVGTRTSSATQAWNAQEWDIR